MRDAAYSALVGAYLACCGLALAMSVERALHKRPDMDLANAWAKGEYVEVLRAAGHLVDSLLQQSELTLALVLANFANLYAIFALVTAVAFLGPLAPRDSSLLAGRLLKYVVFKVIFVFALLRIYRSELLVWLLWLAAVGYLQIFVSAARDRLEGLARALPSACSLPHLRAVALLVAVLAADVLLGRALAHHLAGPSATRLWLCAYDIIVVAIESSRALVRYGIHIIDRARSDKEESTDSDVGGGSDDAHPVEQQAAGHGDDEHEGGVGQHGRGGSSSGRWSIAWGLGGLARWWRSWDGSSALLLHVDLWVDVAIHILTLGHYCHVTCLYGRTLYRQLFGVILILDIRSVTVSLLRRLRAFVKYRAATRNLRVSFPDVVAPQNTRCTICMDRLQACKQLQCGHLFHLQCLRSWLQQSGENVTCPLCRSALFMQPGRLPRSLVILQRALDFLHGSFWNSSHIVGGGGGRHGHRGGRHHRGGGGPGRSHGGGRGSGRGMDTEEGVDESSAPLPDSAAPRDEEHSAAADVALAALAAAAAAPRRPPWWRSGGAGRRSGQGGASLTATAAGVEYEWEWQGGDEEGEELLMAGSSGGGEEEEAGGAEEEREEEQAAVAAWAGVSYGRTALEAGSSGHALRRMDGHHQAAGTGRGRLTGEPDAPAEQRAGPSTWSVGDALPHSLQIVGRAVAHTVRSSIAQDDGGAVVRAAWDDGEEVTSRERLPHRRRLVLRPTAIDGAAT